MQLEGKVALVTGADSGIGKAAALLLAQEGARIGALDLKEDELGQLVTEIESKGSEAIPLIADVTCPEQVQQAVDNVIQQWGRLDIVVANAGINGVSAPIDELEPNEWDRTLDINLKGTFLTVKYAAPYLKHQGGAVIVTSSGNGTRKFSGSGSTPYACSKAGQVAFTKMVALELAKHRVRVNVICPGAIETDIGENTEHRHLEQVREPVKYPEGAIPLTDGEPGKAEQVAQLILFLVSDAANHISGTEVYIDGAQSLLQG